MKAKYIVTEGVAGCLPNQKQYSSTIADAREIAAIIKEELEELGYIVSGDIRKDGRYHARDPQPRWQDTVVEISKLLPEEQFEMED